MKRRLARDLEARIEAEVIKKKKKSRCQLPFLPEFDQPAFLTSQNHLLREQHYSSWTILCRVNYQSRKYLKNLLMGQLKREVFSIEGPPCQMTPYWCQLMNDTNYHIKAPCVRVVFKFSGLHSVISHYLSKEKVRQTIWLTFVFFSSFCFGFCFELGLCCVAQDPSFFLNVLALSFLYLQTLGV